MSRLPALHPALGHPYFAGDRPATAHDHLSEGPGREITVVSPILTPKQLSLT